MPKISESKRIGPRSLIVGQNSIDKDEPLVIRVVIDDIERFPVHWVPLVKDQNNTPIPCASSGCGDIRLPTGEILHSNEASDRFRFIAWSYNENRPIIFECGPGIYNDIITYNNENPDWGDVRQYDLRITAVPKAGPYKVQYRTDPVRTSFGKPLSAEAMTALKAAWGDIQKQFRVDRSKEAVEELIRRLTSKDVDEDTAAVAASSFPGVIASPVATPSPVVNPAAMPQVPQQPVRPAAPASAPIPAQDIFGDLPAL